MPFWGHASGFGFLIFPVMMIVMFIIIMFIMRIFGMGCSSHGGNHSAPADKTPLDILEERFAKGEIDQREFQDKKRLLSS